MIFFFFFLFFLFFYATDIFWIVTEGNKLFFNMPQIQEEEEIGH
jgi:hypothetical protein